MKEIKKEDFYFNQESILENTSDTHLGYKGFKALYDENMTKKLTDFSNIMFSLFLNYFKKFNNLPFIGHVFYLTEYNIFIAIDYYQQETDFDKLGVIFKLKAVEED